MSAAVFLGSKVELYTTRKYILSYTLKNQQKYKKKENKKLLTCARSYL